MSSPANVSTSLPMTCGLDEDLPCPQCKYNLRGLTVPRCPECRFAFNWSDLPRFRVQSGPGQGIPRWLTTILILAAGMGLTFTMLSGDPGVGIWVTIFLSVIIVMFFAVSGAQAAIEMAIAWPIIGKVSWKRFRAWWEGVLIGYGLCATTCLLAGYSFPELFDTDLAKHRASDRALWCLIALTALESLLVQLWVVHRRARQWHDPISKRRLLLACLLAKAFIAVVWTLIVVGNTII